MAVAEPLAVLARLRCRVVSERLGAGPAPAVVVRAAAGADGLICLLGSWADGGALVTSDPLLVLPDGADPIAALGVQPVVSDARPDLVGGGWFGRLAYDGSSRLAFHDHLLRYRDGDWFFEALWSDERDALLASRREESAALLDVPAVTSAWRVGSFGGASRTGHLRAVEEAVGLIRAGEIYQVNVCTRLSAPFSGSTAGLFADVAGTLRPDFAAYVEEPAGQAVVSLSPELFLRRRGRDVLSSPIKGTWPRVAGDETADRVGADALRQSAKDAAENVMIVDLMRNDLARVCETGSVRVPSLLHVQPHPGVWHLVSTVSGRLRPDAGDDDLLRACFPPGSVTGAPKGRAIEVISELEPASRGTHTGAIGFASPSWGAEFSVAIRTFEIADKRIELGVGGGVTADSVPMLEWRECLHKAAPLLGAIGAAVQPSVLAPRCDATARQRAGGLFETLLAFDGAVARRADHLARLDRSCREVYGAALAPDVPERVRTAAAGFAGRAAVRVVVTPDLAVSVEVSPASPPAAASSARTVGGRVGLWRHKWADRGLLDATEDEDDRVPLFIAADGTVLETSRGNVFLLWPDGTLQTAPLRDDLLPGITRRGLLDLAGDRDRPTVLRPFDVTEMLGYAAFWTSALSLAVPIHEVDGRSLPRRDDEVSALASMIFGDSRESTSDPYHLGDQGSGKTVR